MKEDWSTEGDRFWAVMIINSLDSLKTSPADNSWMEPLHQALAEGRWDLIEFAARIKQAIDAPIGDKKHAKEKAKHIAFCLVDIGLHDGRMAMEYSTDPMTKGEIIQFIERNHPELIDSMPTDKGGWRNWWKDIAPKHPRSAGNTPKEWREFFKQQGL